MLNRNLVGRIARGSDGGRIGRIVECNPESFVIESGLIFKKDTFVPYSAVSGMDGEDVVLRDTAEYYRAGGDVSDGHWNRDLARASRSQHGAPTDSAAEHNGLPDGTRRAVDDEDIESEQPVYGGSADLHAGPAHED